MRRDRRSRFLTLEASAPQTSWTRRTCFLHPAFIIIRHCQTSRTMTSKPVKRRCVEHASQAGQSSGYPTFAQASIRGLAKNYVPEHE